MTGIVFNSPLNPNQPDSFFAALTVLMDGLDNLQTLPIPVGISVPSTHLIHTLCLKKHCFGLL